MLAGVSCLGWAVLHELQVWLERLLPCRSGPGCSPCVNSGASGRGSNDLGACLMVLMAARKGRVSAQHISNPCCVVY